MRFRRGSWGALAVIALLCLLISDHAEARRRGKRFKNRFFRRAGRCGQFFCNNNNILRNQNNFADRINADNNEDFAGFPNLTKNGNAILEKTLTRDGLIRLRELTILNDGRLIGAADPVETVSQLRQLYLRNLDAFGIDLDDVCFFGRNRRFSRNISQAADRVARFLRRNGGCDSLTQKITVDLKTHGLKYPGLSDTEIGRRIVNMLVNTVSSSSDLFVLDNAQIKSDGTAELPGLTRFLRSDALAIALSDNPYTKCNLPIPVQWLAERFLNDETYVRMMGIPEKQKELGLRLGVFTDKTQTRGNKTLVYTPPGKPKESQPGLARERILEKQKQGGDISGKFDNIRLSKPGGMYYSSYDFADDPPPGLDEQARSVFGKFGIRATHDASEQLWELPNGLWAGSLYDAKGNRVKNAPINVARGGKLFTISPMAACLDCHIDGINGGGIIPGSNPPRAYTDVFNDSGHPKVEAFSRQFFAKNGNRDYRGDSRSGAIADSASFVNRQIQAQARIEVNGKGVSGVTDAIVQRRKELTEEDQERELRLPAGSRKGAGAISRAQFDDKFCSLKGTKVTSGDTQRLIRDELRLRRRGGRHNRFRF